MCSSSSGSRDQSGIIDDDDDVFLFAGEDGNGNLKEIYNFITDEMKEQPTNISSFGFSLLANKYLDQKLLANIWISLKESEEHNTDKNEAM